MKQLFCTNANNNTKLIAFGMCSTHSNSMMSGNPHSGFYVANTSKTLDFNCGNPTCNQGGIIVLQVKGCDEI